MRDCKMVLVFDASPLIHLGKAKILEKLTAINHKKVIPLSVYNEVVVEGKNLGKEDAYYIEGLVKNNVFNVVEPKKLLKSLPDMNLSKADKEVLSLTKELNGIAVVDESAARKIAEFVGVKTIGSVGILFQLFYDKEMKKNELKETIDSMIKEGWFCSTIFYSKIIKKLS